MTLKNQQTKVVFLVQTDMREIIESNLLSVRSGIIGHQVNCKGCMNAGIAKSLRKEYPTVFYNYALLCNTRKPLDLLGMIQPVTVSDKLKVFNLFGQHSYGCDRQQTDYSALSTIAAKLIQRDITIHLPYGIGCGYGGGDWDVVRELFDGVKGVWYLLK